MAADEGRPRAVYVRRRVGVGLAAVGLVGAVLAATQALGSDEDSEGSTVTTVTTRPTLTADAPITVGPRDGAPAPTAVSDAETTVPSSPAAPLTTITNSVAAPTVPPTTATSAPTSTAGATVTSGATPAGTAPTTLVDEALPSDPTAPVVQGVAYGVYDATSGRWLTATNGDAARPVGSIMKLLTTYVVMRAGDPSKVVTVPPLTLDPQESAIGLYAGEQLPRDVLLRAMLIVSANDAAEALAIDVGGTREGFVQQMNEAARELGLDETVASNPSGLDGNGAVSTVRDAVTLAAELMKDETFRTTVARPSARLHGQEFPATNDLLGTYPGADGIKTGSTTQAGYGVVASATRQGRTIIVAVLGAPTDGARFTAAAALLDWAFTRPA